MKNLHSLPPPSWFRLSYSDKLSGILWEVFSFANTLEDYAFDKRRVRSNLRVISAARFPIGGKNARVISLLFITSRVQSWGLRFPRMDSRASGISARVSIGTYLRRASIDFHSNDIGTGLSARLLADAIIADIFRATSRKRQKIPAVNAAACMLIPILWPSHWCSRECC